MKSDANSAAVRKSPRRFRIGIWSFSGVWTAWSLVLCHRAFFIFNSHFMPPPPLDFDDQFQPIEPHLRQFTLFWPPPLGLLFLCCKSPRLSCVFVVARGCYPQIKGIVSKSCRYVPNFYEFKTQNSKFSTGIIPKYLTQHATRNTLF